MAGTTALTRLLTDPKEQQRAAARRQRQHEAWLHELVELEFIPRNLLAFGTELGPSGTIMGIVNDILANIAAVRAMLSEPGSALRWALSPPRELSAARRLSQLLAIVLCAELFFGIRQEHQLKNTQEARKKSARQKRDRVIAAEREIRQRVEALLAEGNKKTVIYELVGKEFDASDSTISRLLRGRLR